MSEIVYNIFCILRGKNPLKRVPVQIFQSKDYTNAKLYFQGYILGDKNPEDYILYKIGEIDKKLKITERKIFIAGGFEIAEQQKYENTKEKIKQIKMDFKKNGEIEEMRKELKQEEIIEKLFNGRTIC